MLKKSFFALIMSVLLIGIVSGCTQSTSKEEGKGTGKQTVKIGYFPNLTHSATIIALEKGFFEEEFGEDVKIETKTVANGGLFMEAMATNAIDVGTVGPGPLLNFYVKNPEYHLISGAVNGGAVLVASEGSKVTDLKDLDGKKVAIPVIGSTQDVMLRKALQDVDLKPTTNGGTVELYAAAPADTTALFVQKSVDAAATQEPWGYVLENQAKGKLVLDWDQFAWGKDSPNTVVAASQKFLDKKGLAASYLKAHKKAVDFIQNNPEESQELVIKHLKKLTGKELSKEEVTSAFSRLEVTTEVNEQVIQEMADISKEAGYVPSSDIKGMVDLSILKEVSK
ncbi:MULTISPECIES: aliphatic sulfonate ABC transporter substrate-binding protein [Peribacillus]|uniref:aliphatic sulfonate ABC transporter substrate-binding protein n=1 Tax=Peribacillus TaxID=2675229 RepID=UPI0019130458|nr:MULTISPECIES: aliphatic sulfonate ABC transporter substrate-binding protein [unclassified Peribacillus]MBK5445571.1 aliphatic sulfonate ABC transporter substrate-binding protein [Peribacillus sp. TH24]MBK5459708.1 aliphatic sulfonate ABC transporter substrate-binding protein [Peribacillus sp. TH27]MBK5481517.1 aliphatic sulfonate ABC transporter substrate-binding protein [Peribacillus sp. TH16]MBK5497899.1 aliphatic sulfonate ABC transporter substrate-binding protein [Peribacillus sp. TH14]